ncbi:MAG TPA: ABC transporter permease [Chloroflexota bacterium]|nr:ABC transporter permease [Chloroflexota bacterium]
MTAYLIRRLIHSVFVLIGVSLLVFFVGRMIGDPARLMLPLEASEAQVEALRARLGFDQPIYIQLFKFLGDLARGDFGMSIWQGVPAMSLVISRFPATVYLTLAVVGFSLLVALPMGIVAAVWPRSAIDRLTTVISVTGVSMPTFWLALMLIIVFAVNLNWFKTSGYGGVEYLILPVLALSVTHIGRIAQVVRSCMLDELSKPYITTARSKGLQENETVVRHALRNAAIPVITLTADEVAGLINGAVVIEVIFAWPGIGMLALDAIERRDFPVVQADVMLVAAVVVIMNLVVDLAYAYVDPRIRYA